LTSSAVCPELRAHFATRSLQLVFPVPIPGQA